MFTTSSLNQQAQDVKRAVEAADLPPELKEKLSGLPPRLAEGLLRVWLAMPRPGGAASPAPVSPQEERRGERPAPCGRGAPRVSLSKGEGLGSALEKLGLSTKEEKEWQALLEKAEERIRKHGDWEKLGPLAPMVRLLVALALRLGAGGDPHREAVIFLTQWELAQMLGVSLRTLERWLGAPAYAKYRRVARRWIAWRVWRTDGRPIGKPHPVKGGTVWRVKVKPRKKPFNVLAPQLRWFWRDLGVERKEGRTARVLALSGYNTVRYKSLLRVGKGVTLQGVRGRDVKADLIRKTSVRFYPDTPSFRDLRDLLFNPPTKRRAHPQWVQEVAQRISTTLRDGTSLRFWLRMAWIALRKGPAFQFALLRAVQLAREAMEEGRIRNAGAYACAVLKGQGFWAA